MIALCRRCGQMHNPMHPCPAVTKPVTAVTKPVTPVTQKITSVTNSVTTHCAACGQQLPKYKSAADKQRAYRKRKADGKTLIGGAQAPAKV
jgi:hypothetical protein